jgi:hypothetical protein
MGVWASILEENKKKSSKYDISMNSDRSQKRSFIIDYIEFLNCGGIMKKLKKSRPVKKAKKNAKSGLKLKRLARKKKLLKNHNN